MLPRLNGRNLWGWNFFPLNYIEVLRNFSWICDVASVVEFAVLLTLWLSRPAIKWVLTVNNQWELKGARIKVFSIYKKFTKNAHTYICTMNYVNFIWIVAGSPFTTSYVTNPDAEVIKGCHCSLSTKTRPVDAFSRVNFKPGIIRHKIRFNRLRWSNL